MIARFRDRLLKAEVQQRSATCVVLDPDLLQQSMQFFCSLAELLYIQAVGTQR